MQKKLLRENSITLGLAMELARYGKDLQKTICKDRLKDEEGWRKYSVKEFKRMVDAHYTNDLARYRFDQTACAKCKHNTNLYDMFATGSGRCTNRECLEAKKTANSSSEKAENCSRKTRNSSFEKTVTDATTMIRP